MNYDEIIDAFHKMVQNKTEECLRELLRQYLKREPVDEDGQLITIGTNPNWDYDLIMIEGRQVGKLVRDFSKSNMVTVTFIPDKEYTA